MASQDLFQPHLLWFWFCAFISDSLVRVFKPLNICPPELTGTLGMIFTSSTPSWKDEYWKRAQQQLHILPRQLPSDLLLQAGTSQHPSVLSAFCACWGEKDSISSWPNDKEFGLKISPIY